MAHSSNYTSKGRKHGYPAQSSSSAAADMSRSDSGYYSSNVVTHHTEYNDHGDQTLAGTGGDYLHTYSVSHDWTGEHVQQQDFYLSSIAHNGQPYSEYITGYTGSQMAAQYPDPSIPRTAGNFMVDGSPKMELDLDQSMAVSEHNQRDFDNEDTLDTAVWEHQNAADYDPSDFSQVDFEYDFASAPSQVKDHDTMYQYGGGRDLESTLVSPSLDLRAPGPSAGGQPLVQRQPPKQPLSQSGPASQQVSMTTTGTTVHPRFLCLHPECGKYFNRPADLDRHQKNVHCKDRNKGKCCDYRSCGRHDHAFRRPDHFRDHLRDIHREDLLKRGGAAEADADWWKGRSPTAVYNGWWRCGKCFRRVSVDKHDWQCPGCGNVCEQDRQAVRRLPLYCDYPGCGVDHPEGPELFKDPGRFREHLRAFHAEDVPKNEGKAGLAELQSEQWWASRYVATMSWRCTRCLAWVDHGRNGWVCETCGFECEERRRACRNPA
ncbi:hypothetical protein DL546_002187 [Coniochaeta pulveracea]|uniref:C2H2-type domain-containing protein n=1 Tax=Coniochaeta pulveracea TaxID=177199 RepID=A0A420YND3_9PEZI|nr:hypothetical protein DL546_002187 [Coniochaeta pulveracea]